MLVKGVALVYRIENGSKRQSARCNNAYWNVKNTFYESFLHMTATSAFTTHVLGSNYIVILKARIFPSDCLQKRP